MTCPKCGVVLVQKVERGGMLLRGKAPIMRFERGRFSIEQRCYNCHVLTTYSPITLRVQGAKNADSSSAKGSAG